MSILDLDVLIVVCLWSWRHVIVDSRAVAMSMDIMSYEWEEMIDEREI